MSDDLKWMNRHAVMLREPQWAHIAETENYKIRPDLRPLFDAHPDSQELLDAMAERKLYREGCEFLARNLHRRVAVWWGYGCLLSLFAERNEVAAGVKAPAKSAVLEKVEALAKKTPFKMPALGAGLDNLANFCKPPEIDIKKMLADYVPPPQDPAAIKAAAAAVKAKISAIDRLLPDSAKHAFEASRAKRIAEYVRQTGMEPKARLQSSIERARTSFVTYKVKRADSEHLQGVLGLPNDLEASRKDTVAQIQSAFPEKYPATPEAAALLKADAKKRSDDAVQAVWRWIVSPDERNTTLAMEAGNAVPGTPEGLLAFTAAWSFGDLAPEGKMTVPVPPELPGTGLNSALLMMALDQGGHRKMQERYELYFMAGLEVAFGKNLWAEAVSEELSPHAKLEEKFKGGAT